MSSGTDEVTSPENAMASIENAVSHDDPDSDAVRAILMDVLAIDDPARITPDARFFDDLDGESIELLETSFQCEKRFGVRLEFQKLFDQGRLDVDERGRIARPALQRMQHEHPYLSIERLPEGPTVEDLKSLLTVDVITQLVGRAVAARPAEAADR